MNKIYNACETALNAVSIVISVQDLNDIINLILLIVSLISILVRVAITVYKHLKNEDYDSAVNEIDKAKDEIDKLNHKEEDKHD